MGKPVVETMPAAGATHSCPECDSDGGLETRTTNGLETRATLLLTRGRFGPFYSCTGFPLMG